MEIGDADCAALAFESKKQLFNAFQKLAIMNNFSLCIVRSDDKKGKIVISCDRAGVYSSSASKRMTKTKKTGCLYRVFGKRIGEGLWKFARQEGEHNHDMCVDIRVHSRARRLTEEQKLQRQRLEQAGVKPKAQLAFLRQEYDGFCAVQQDLYNEKQSDRIKFLNGRSTMQALFDVVQENQYHFEHCVDSEGHLTHLMFAHPSSVSLARQFHTVLLFDCTYKTNKFGLPLLVCTGLSPSNKSFFCCGIFMHGERERDYVWALRAVQRLLGDGVTPSVVASDNEAALLGAGLIVFPSASQLICRWHVNKNIVKKCKQYFTDSDRHPDEEMPANGNR